MKQRRIRASGTLTPLLVPSFSSVDSWGHARFNAHATGLGERLLVSAYDIYHHGFDVGNAIGTQLIILDSGGYEARIAGRYARWLKVDAPAWSPELYDKCIEVLPDGPSYLLVTYDHGQALSYEDQLHYALEFKNRHNGRSVDWLLKPEPGEFTLTPDRLADAMASAHEFDAIGVTYDELGTSLAERVQNMAVLRGILARHGHDTPIHVFGCLTFSAVLPLIQAGADVFDGLAWTRHVFHKGRAANPHDYRLGHRLLDTTDAEFFPRIDSHNLDALDDLQGHLRRYAKDHDSTWLGPLVPDLVANLTTLKAQGERYGPQ